LKGAIVGGRLFGKKKMSHRGEESLIGEYTAKVWNQMGGENFWGRGEYLDSRHRGTFWDKIYEVS